MEDLELTGRHVEEYCGDGSGLLNCSRKRNLVELCGGDGGGGVSGGDGGGGVCEQHANGVNGGV